MDRARLTLFNITDIWKSKIKANKLEKSNDKINVNRRALNVLNVWAWPRRSPSTHQSTPNAFTQQRNTNSNHEENADAKHHHHHHRQQHAGHSIIVSIENKNKTKPNNLIEKNAKHKGKHCVSDGDAKPNNMVTRRKSLELCINHMHDMEHMVPLHRRRGSWGSIAIPKRKNLTSAIKHRTATCNGKPNSDGQSVQPKNRIKLKIKSKSRDDASIDSIKAVKSSKILKRQTSVVPIITINDFDRSCDSNSLDKIIGKKHDECENVLRKPRKKLSFREPIVSNETLQRYRSSSASQRRVVKNNENCTKIERTELIDEVCIANVLIHKPNVFSCNFL